MPKPNLTTNITTNTNINNLIQYLSRPMMAKVLKLTPNSPEFLPYFNKLTLVLLRLFKQHSQIIDASYLISHRDILIKKLANDPIAILLKTILAMEVETQSLETLHRLLEPIFTNWLLQIKNFYQDLKHFTTTNHDENHSAAQSSSSQEPLTALEKQIIKLIMPELFKCLRIHETPTHNTKISYLFVSLLLVLKESQLTMEMLTLDLSNPAKNFRDGFIEECQTVIASHRDEILNLTNNPDQLFAYFRIILSDVLMRWKLRFHSFTREANLKNLIKQQLSHPTDAQTDIPTLVVDDNFLNYVDFIEAIGKPDIDSLRELVLRNPDVLTNPTGLFACYPLLHLAIFLKNEAAAIWLITYGANVFAYNSYGQQPLDLACDAGFIGLCRVINAYGEMPPLESTIACSSTNTAYLDEKTLLLEIVILPVIRDIFRCIRTQGVFVSNHNFLVLAQALLNVLQRQGNLPEITLDTARLLYETLSTISVSHSFKSSTLVSIIKTLTNEVQFNIYQLEFVEKNVQEILKTALIEMQKSYCVAQTYRILERLKKSSYRIEVINQILPVAKQQQMSAAVLNNTRALITFIVIKLLNCIVETPINEPKKALEPISEEKLYRLGSNILAVLQKRFSANNSLLSKAVLLNYSRVACGTLKELTKVITQARLSIGINQHSPELTTEKLNQFFIHAEKKAHEKSRENTTARSLAQRVRR